VTQIRHRELDGIVPSSPVIQGIRRDFLGNSSFVYF